MMLEFRQAAAANDLSALQKLSQELGADFNINEPGPSSGKTAIHVAAERAHFAALYWLLEGGADLYSLDNKGKTAVDYLQEKEFNCKESNFIVKGDRQYTLCNVHYKIWLAHDPEIFMPYLYQDDFRQYREKNPEGYLSLVYSEALLGEKAKAELLEFAEKCNIQLISFESDLAALTDQFGTQTDKYCYKAASYEIKHYPNQKGGNLAVVADLIRWSSVLLRIGSYTDTDVEIGQHKWTSAIRMEKHVALNLGSLIYPNNIEAIWVNGDIIAIPSLFPQPHTKGHFRITLSKAACFMIQQVQLSLLMSCQKGMERRMQVQRIVIHNFSNPSFYMKDYFRSWPDDQTIRDNFSSSEIHKIQEEGLEGFSKPEKASIIEKMANLMRRKVEQEHGSAEVAHRYSRVFQNTNHHEHEKFLMNYMQALQMSTLKESVKNLTGIYVFSGPLANCIEPDQWKQYSIYSNEKVQFAFRSTNTVKFNTDNAENEKATQTSHPADLSFTPFGMQFVMQRSQELKVEHTKNALN